jgi:hypothetical protein
MKLLSSIALGLLAAAPALASASVFQVDFEKTWDYANGSVDGYYSGGTAADGTSGPDLGVSFVGVSGLSNDNSFTYYTGAPSMQGTAYAYTSAPGDKALMNVAAGVGGALAFYYASPSDVIGAVKAYSGLNGTGTLLGTFDLVANGAAYDVWTPVTFNFTGVARSFDLTGSANVVGLDNIRAVPEPESYAMALAGLGVIGLLLSRRRQA